MKFFSDFFLYIKIPKMPKIPFLFLPWIPMRSMGGLYRAMVSPAHRWRSLTGTHVALQAHTSAVGLNWQIDWIVCQWRLVCFGGAVGLSDKCLVKIRVERMDFYSNSSSIFDIIKKPPFFLLKRTCKTEKTTNCKEILQKQEDENGYSKQTNPRK